MTYEMELVIGLLTFLAVVSIGGAFLMLRSERQKHIKRRLHGLEDGTDAEPEEVTGKRQLGSLARLSQSLSPGKPSESLRAQLARAGFHDRSAAKIYIGSKMLLLLAGVVASVALTASLGLELPVQALIATFCGGLLSFIPNIIVQVQRGKRSAEVRRHLPDAVDLLEICVSSGMGLDQAWNAVSDEVRRVSPTLADEMALTNLEMHLGGTRTTAMRHMVARTGAEELGSLVAVLVQSERFGTSVSDALRTFSSSLRVARSQRAEESAEKMAVKLLFPLILFIFPAMIVVVAGPAGVLLIQHVFGK